MQRLDLNGNSYIVVWVENPCSVHSKSTYCAGDFPWALHLLSHISNRLLLEERFQSNRKVTVDFSKLCQDKIPLTELWLASYVHSLM